MSEWRPIETALKDGKLVLVGAWSLSGNWQTEVGYWGISRWHPFVGQTGSPTHWMPLPEPPK
jgi:hypothetical protein